MLVIITWYDSRNYTKLVLKPFAAKNGLSISVYYSFPVDYIISVYMMTILHSYILPLHWGAAIFDELKLEAV